VNGLLNCYYKLASLVYMPIPKTVYADVLREFVSAGQVE